MKMKYLFCNRVLAGCWKTWKVLEFIISIFRPGKSWNLSESHGKSWKVMEKQNAF